MLDAILNRMYHQMDPNALFFVEQKLIQLYRFILYQNHEKQTNLEVLPQKLSMQPLDILNMTF